MTPPLTSTQRNFWRTTLYSLFEGEDLSRKAAMKLKPAGLAEYLYTSATDVPGPYASDKDSLKKDSLTFARYWLSTSGVKSSKFVARATTKIGDFQVVAASKVPKENVLNLKPKDDVGHNKIIKQLVEELTTAEVSKLKSLYSRMTDGIAVANKMSGDARLRALDKVCQPVADWLADHLGLDKKERRGKPGKYGDTMIHKLTNLASRLHHRVS